MKRWLLFLLVLFAATAAFGQQDVSKQKERKRQIEEEINFIDRQLKTITSKQKATTEQLSQKASAGAVVKGRGFNLVAINESNKATDRSSRSRKLRACLSLIENTIAERGWRTVYIRVKGPDGILMTDDSGKVFTCGGEQMIYSASREVDYQGDEVEICIYFANSQGFEKGKYTVDFYTDETRLGPAERVLK